MDNLPFLKCYFSYSGLCLFLKSLFLVHNVADVFPVCHCASLQFHLHLVGGCFLCCSGPVTECVVAGLLPASAGCRYAFMCSFTASFLKMTSFFSQLSRAHRPSHTEMVTTGTGWFKYFKQAQKNLYIRYCTALCLTPNSYLDLSI